MDKYDTEIRGWFIVQLMDDENKPVGEILWGIVIEDKKLRFLSGDYVCSSLINVINDNFIQTNNSVYKLIGQGKREYILPMDSILALRDGISPEIIMGLILDKKF